MYFVPSIDETDICLPRQRWTVPDIVQINDPCWFSGRGNLIIFNKLNFYHVDIRQSKASYTRSQSQGTLPLSYLQIVGYILYPDGMDVCIDKNRKL